MALTTVVATQSAHAQESSVTTSDNQKSVARQSSGDKAETEPATDAQLLPQPFKSGRWFSRVGYLVAAYHSSTTIATNGQLLSGGSAEASNNMSLTFDLGYEVTKNISVSVMSGIPVKPHVTGEGAASSLGILGKVRYGPAIFSGYYRFPKLGRFRPYVGGGAAYAIIFKNFDGSVQQLKVHNNWGSVLQGGAEYEVKSKYTLFIDCKEVWLAVKANGVLSDGTDVKARVKLNPSIVTVGIKFYLPFGRSH
ncbi:MAG TPA: OmpW family outer membrane protein [Pyrinomonadaceae bacterium]